MILTELLDNPFKFFIEDDDDGDGYLGYFHDAEENLVIVSFQYWMRPEIVLIDFKRKGSFDMTNDSPENRNQGVRIMATVIAITRKVLDRSGDKIKFISFSAKNTEASRASLYDRLVKKLIGSMGFVVVTDVEKVEHDTLPGWWRNKLKMTQEHNLTLLARKDMLKDNK